MDKLPSVRFQYEYSRSATAQNELLLSWVLLYNISPLFASKNAHNMRLSWAVRVLAIKHFAVVLFLTILPARRGKAILAASFEPVAVDLGIVLANNLNLGWG